MKRSLIPVVAALIVVGAFFGQESEFAFSAKVVVAKGLDKLGMSSPWVVGVLLDDMVRKLENRVPDPIKGPVEVAKESFDE